MDIKELYGRKGEAHTQIEIWQQVLQQVNKEISAALSDNQKVLNELSNNKETTKEPDTKPAN